MTMRRQCVNDEDTDQLIGLVEELMETVLVGQLMLAQQLKPESALLELLDDDMKLRDTIRFIARMPGLPMIGRDRCSRSEQLLPQHHRGIAKVVALLQMAVEPDDLARIRFRPVAERVAWLHCPFPFCVLRSALYIVASSRPNCSGATA